MSGTLDWGAADALNTGPSGQKLTPLPGRVETSEEPLSPTSSKLDEVASKGLAQFSSPQVSPSRSRFQGKVLSPLNPVSRVGAGVFEHSVSEVFVDKEASLTITHRKSSVAEPKVVRKQAAREPGAAPDLAALTDRVHQRCRQEIRRGDLFALGRAIAEVTAYLENSDECEATRAAIFTEITRVSKMVRMKAGSRKGQEAIVRGLDLPWGSNETAGEALRRAQKRAQEWFLETYGIHIYMPALEAARRQEARQAREIFETLHFLWQHNAERENLERYLLDRVLFDQQIIDWDSRIAIREVVRRHQSTVAIVHLMTWHYFRIR